MWPDPQETEDLVTFTEEILSDSTYKYKPLDQRRQEV